MPRLFDRSRTQFFFFQAEDGIRDLTVTGVQTCALPILLERLQALPGIVNSGLIRGITQLGIDLLHANRPSSSADLRIEQSGATITASVRSEERRVGKECRSRWSPYH